jgi:DNA mismatch repair ATPase MutS
VIERHDWQHNQFFAPFGAAVLWGTQCAWAVEAWRGRHGAHVPEWLQVVGEVEALAALGTYAFEHPADPFPELVEGGAVPCFEAEALGHPLIPEARLVANDLRIGPRCQLLVVSGSNMSGKSTLLRAVGANAVLAFAGAPVRSGRLRLSPVAIGATLRVQDSLQAGRSRFYAEITRVREVADLASGGRPVLFLFDELFHGTNSHDRVAGAEAVLGRFLDHGAIGLVTTHDLALAAVADRLAPRASNVHFEDRFEGGEIQFDYRLRPGPVARSNALALMHAVGLTVAPPPAATFRPPP